MKTVNNHSTGPAMDSQRPQITTKDGSSFEVTKEGSLSLLALGYRGLLAWRAKRKDAMKEQPPTTNGPDEQA